MLPKILKSKKILFLLAVICCLLFGLSPVFAQEQDWDARQGTPEQFGEALDASGVNMEKMGVYDTLQVIPNALNCGIVGLGCTAKEEQSYQYQQNSVVGITGNLIAGMYANPPASFTYYAYDLLQNAGLAPKAYAQGIGFSGLTPILPLWKAFRNIAYMLLVVVLIVIGFMIMFRMKIDPQTVISIQNALPRIAITLLLITFSYAIVGLMIDLMYVLFLLGIAVVHPALQAVEPGSNLADVQTELLTGGVRQLLGYLFGVVPLRFWVGEAIGGILGVLFLPLKVGGLIGRVVGAIGVHPALGAIVGGLGIGSGIMGLLLALAFLFAFIRIFILLLTSYIQIIVNAIFAPIFLLMGALPGQNTFTSWLRGLIGNIIVFPAVAILMLVAHIITRSISLGGRNIWSPPLLPELADRTALVVIALGFSFLIPQLAGTLKKKIVEAPVLPVGAAAAGIVTAPASLIQQAIATFATFKTAGLGLPKREQ